MSADLLRNYICVICGSQFAESERAPASCPICEDERQYIGPNGQEWTTLEGLQASGCRNVFREQEQRLIGIATEPKFGIGERALLVQTPGGNVLWDCISLLDEETIRQVRELGGLRAIAISHPHYYTCMVEWSRAFGDVPIYLHEADRQWVQRPDERIKYWSGETLDLGNGLTLIRTGGHFDGFQVLHWSGGAEGRGVMLTGDQPQVCADPRWVSFMWSYPNFVPLSPAEVRRIVAAMEPYNYDRLYGAFWPSVVRTGARGVVQRSAERYLRRMAEPSPG
jgi:hypothetical protein